jgi:fucose permease
VTSNGHQPQPARSHPFLLAIAYLGFISLGLPDTLIGVAWPSVRDTFQLPQSAVALVFIGGGISYFFSSFFTGRLLNSFGIGALLAGSSALVALSGFGYGAAPVWMLFAVCSLFHGLGSGAIDAGLNHYVAHHFSARHMNWLHACYSIGATLGPLTMTAVIAWHGSWRMGYLVIACTLFLLALLFAVTHRRWDEPGTTDPAPEAAANLSLGAVLRHSTVWVQAALFFVYTGLESSMGQWSYTILTEARHVPRDTAGLWVTTYWGSIAAGRILFGFVVDRIGIDRLLRWSMVTAFVGTGLFAWNLSATISGIAMAITGLGLAPIYPCMMSRTPQRLGKAMAAHAIGLQVSTAMLGVAALPSLCGLLAQRFGVATVAGATMGIALVVTLLHESLLARPPAGRAQP